MRKIIFICTVMCINFSYAQETGKFRGGLDVGFSPYNSTVNNFGFLGAMELKYNFQKNMNVGLKTEAMSIRTCKCYGAELLSFSVSYDYYFHYKNKTFSPFIAAGLGYYFRRAHEGHTDILYKYNNPTCFFRTGFELWKFRTSLTYNLIRKPQKYKNRNIDYISFTIGFYIGGGKWRKKLASYTTADREE
jgi:hypothetical protein